MRSFLTAAFAAGGRCAAFVLPCKRKSVQIGRGRAAVSDVQVAPEPLFHAEWEDSGLF